MKILSFLISLFVFTFLSFGNRLPYETLIQVRGRRRQEISMSRIGLVKASLAKIKTAAQGLGSLVKNQRAAAHHKVACLFLAVERGLDLVLSLPLATLQFQSLLADSPLVPPPKV